MKPSNALVIIAMALGCWALFIVVVWLVWVAICSLK